MSLSHFTKIELQVMSGNTIKWVTKLSLKKKDGLPLLQDKILWGIASFFSLEFVGKWRRVYRKMIIHLPACLPNIKMRTETGKRQIYSFFTVDSCVLLFKESKWFLWENLISKLSKICLIEASLRASERAR